MLQYDKINRILSGIQWSYYRDFIDFRKKVLAVRSQWRAGSDPIGSRSGERVNLIIGLQKLQTVVTLAVYFVTCSRIY